MIMVCLIANEIDYQRQEILFLKEILIKLYFHLNIHEYRCFLIRFFVLCGTKELNIDYLQYALDFCQNDSKYFVHFAMGEHFSGLFLLIYLNDFHCFSLSLFHSLIR